MDTKCTSILPHYFPQRGRTDVGLAKGMSAPTLMTPAVMVKTLEDFQASDGTSIKKATLLVAFEKAEGSNKATLYHCEGKHGKVGHMTLIPARAHASLASRLDSAVEPCACCERETLRSSCAPQDRTLLRDC